MGWNQTENAIAIRASRGNCRGRRAATRWRCAAPLLLPLLAILASAAPAEAQNWLQRVFPPRNREAPAQDQAFKLTEEHGPWLIFCCSFSGDGAEQQARDLAQELRQRFRLPAYVHWQNYDLSKPVQGLGVNKFGGPKIMRHRQNIRFTEWAVLVGNFDSVSDPRAERTCEMLKTARPAALDIEQRGGQSTQRFVGFRRLQRFMSPDEEKKAKGPMGSAFITRNPALPEQYFAPKGIDSLVVKMNRGVKYSLLENPGRITVKIATYRGQSTFNTEEGAAPIRRGNQPTKLELAAERAHQVCTALREKGVPAWEFHDRYESIVTVGSFDELEQKAANGSQINPGILSVIQTYGPRQANLAGGVKSVQPASVEGIPLDVQPTPMEVPRRSVGADYARQQR